MSCREINLPEIGFDLSMSKISNSRYYQISKNTFQVFGGIVTEEGIDLGGGLILPYGFWYRFNNGKLEIHKELPVS